MIQGVAGGKEPVLKAVRASFEREPRINLHRYPVRIEYADGVLTLEGEVEHVAAKKIGMKLAVGVAGVAGIVDRLHVKPASRMGDGAILEAVRDVLLQEPALMNCTIRIRRKGALETVREATVEPRGVIQVSVKDGVVLLDDHVLTQTQKRIAGVLAWWVPGSRDVVNGMEVMDPTEDTDEELAKAVRLALKKDPFVDPDRITVTVQSGVVRLDGDVPSEPQREMAEFDAWYVFGVDNVDNRLSVR